MAFLFSPHNTSSRSLSLQVVRTDFRRVERGLPGAFVMMEAVNPGQIKQMSHLLGANRVMSSNKSARGERGHPQLVD